MNLLHLHYFFEVAKSRSFSQAAKSLRISQPAISKMVRQLELQVDRTLILRHRNGLKLTSDGEWLFQHASKIFDEVRNIQESLNSSEKSLRGQWCLGASDNIAMYLLPGLLGTLKRQHPLLEMSLFSGTSSQIKDEIRHNRVQLGICYTPGKKSEPFEYQEVGQSEFWIVVSPKLLLIKQLLKKRKKIKLDDLISQKVPRFESRHADYPHGFPAHFHSRRLGLTAPSWIQVNNHEVKKRFVMGGWGYALLTRHTVEAEVRSGALIRVESPLVLNSSIYAVWKKGQVLDRASKIFIEAFSRSTSMSAGTTRL